MFNLKKMSKNKSVDVFDNLLKKDREDTFIDSDNNEKSISGLLEPNRKNAENTGTYESIMDESRKNQDNQSIIEKSFEKGDNYPHRPKRSERVLVSDIDVKSHLNDNKFREDFSKENKKGDTSFWDKYVNSQLLGEKTTIVRQIPDEASQLQNRPSRFNKVKDKELYEEGYADKDFNIKKMNTDKEKKIASSLKDADSMLFYTYHTAYSQNRDLNEKEKQIINAINSEKHQILSQYMNIDEGKDMVDFISDENPDVERPSVSDHNRMVDDIEDEIELKKQFSQEIQEEMDNE